MAGTVIPLCHLTGDLLRDPAQPSVQPFHPHVENTVPLIRMLGPLHVGDPLGPPLTTARRKERELLALLVLRAGSVVGTTEIVDCLWDAGPPVSARANLHSYVYRLRLLLARAAPGVQLQHARQGYCLDLSPEECDATVFERGAAAGRQALADRRPAEAAELLEQALSLWRGPVLDGIDQHDWIAPVAARLEESRLAAVEDHVQARIALGRLGDVIAELTGATARYPLRERLWGHLMIALHRTGRRAEALDAYGRLYEVLERELGARPGPAVRDLHRRIRAAS